MEPGEVKYDEQVARVLHDGLGESGPGSFEVAESRLREATDTQAGFEPAEIPHI